MRAMVLHQTHERLVMEERPEPSPGPGQVRVRVEACGVCRTDLHVVDGELPNPKLPIVPGHEIVGRVDAVGEGVDLKFGARVGVAWLGHTDGTCPYCRSGRENLCDAPLFTGYTRDGGYATHTIAEADFVFPLSEDLDPIEAAPLLCAGLIGWRSLKLAGDGRTFGVYGFAAAGHIIAQVCRWQGRRVFAFTRPGDHAGQAFARSVGVDWAGGSGDPPPEPLDAAILVAPAGAPVPKLAPADVHEFLGVAPEAKVRTTTTPYPLDKANEALDDLRKGALEGAAVLVPRACARVTSWRRKGRAARA